MGATSAEPDTSEKCCLICTVPIHFTRLGVHACRACAAFYKRVKISGKRLICRQGDNNCVFRKHEKFVCKRCRFDKCVELGMEYDAGGTEVENDGTSDGNIPSSSSSSPEPTLLEKLRIAYDICCESRRAQELELVKEHKLERVPHPSEEVYLLNFECAVTAATASLDELWKFFLTVFPALQNLSDADQNELYRMCIPQFVTADCRSRSIRLWGKIDRYMMASVLMCTDAERLEVWAGPQINGPLRNEIVSVIRSYMEDQKASIVPAFEKAELHEKEVLALLPLLLSEAELPIETSERCQPLLDSIRREILDDLHRFYTEEMGISQYSTRLGNLLTICASSREAYELFKKFFLMQVSIFDLYEAETQLQDLIL